MIVVKPRYPERKYCYGGSGVFGNLLSKVVSSTIAQKVVNTATRDGIKSIINKAVSSPIAHKFADSALQGATSATQKLVENAIVETLKRPRKEEDKKKNGNKKSRIDITDLVNGGSGIVLD
jgi:hypothetical protein